MPYVVINLSDYEYERICREPECINPIVNYAVRRGVIVPEEINMFAIPDACKDYLEKRKKEEAERKKAREAAKKVTSNV